MQGIAGNLIAEYRTFNLDKINYKEKLFKKIMGMGDWGFGDWGLGIGPNPQSPIPNPQSPIPKKNFKFFS